MLSSIIFTEFRPERRQAPSQQLLKWMLGKSINQEQSITLLLSNRNWTSCSKKAGQHVCNCKFFEESQAELVLRATAQEPPGPPELLAISEESKGGPLRTKATKPGTLWCCPNDVEDDM